MSRQIAELYLRGSLINQTMKNLTQEQMNIVEQKLDELLNNSSLRKCREKFCKVLAKTINGDYTDKEVALNDYRIALMRGIIYILYHRPNPEVFNDPKQITKLFKNFAFEYMKQILNENKIPHSKSSVKMKAHPKDLATEHLKIELDQLNIKHQQHGGLIKLDRMTPKVAKRLELLNRKYEQHGIRISLSDSTISIDQDNDSPDRKIETTIQKKIKIKIHDIYTDSEESNNHSNYSVEHAIYKKKETRNISEMGNILPDDVRDLFHALTDDPDGVPANPTHRDLAKYLNITIDEVKSRMKKLKIYSYYYIESEHL